MRYIYTALLYLALPWLLFRLWWKGRKFPAYKLRWQERFGFFQKPNFDQCIWVHAVSYGESVAAEPLIKYLLNTYPQHQLAVTTMTPTGSERICKSFGEQVFHVYLPHDFPGAIKRFLNKINPLFSVIMETELWPNILHQCGQRQIPVLLANARLSARSAKGYSRIRMMTKNMLKQITTIAAQSQTDADRFIELGATHHQVMITGSIKFDVSIPKSLIDQGKILRQSWALDRPIWIAASTHEGEETQILNAFTKIREQLPNSMLILVPRHPERFDDVYKLCTQSQSNFKVVRRSQGLACDHQTDIFLGDTMGEMYVFYAAADIAFVGGSLMPIGGHNILEPAVVHLPIVTGPYLFNSTEINELMCSAGACTVVNNEDELATTLINLFQNQTLREQQGKNAYQVLEQNRGALQKHIDWIDNIIKSLHRTPATEKIAETLPS